MATKQDETGVVPVPGKWVPEVPVTADKQLPFGARVDPFIPRPPQPMPR